MARNDCYGCTKRQVGCHATCESYKKFREQVDEENRKMRLAKSVVDDNIGSIKTYWQRVRRKA